MPPESPIEINLTGVFIVSSLINKIIATPDEVEKMMRLQSNMAIVSHVILGSIDFSGLHDDKRHIGSLLCSNLFYSVRGVENRPKVSAG